MIIKRVVKSRAEVREHFKALRAASLEHADRRTGTIAIFRKRRNRYLNESTGIAYSLDEVKRLFPHRLIIQETQEPQKISNQFKYNTK